MINKTAERIAKAIILIMGVLTLLGLGKVLLSQRELPGCFYEIIYVMMSMALLVGFLIMIYKIPN